MQQEIASSKIDMNKQTAIIRILGVSGSLRENSNSTRVLSTLLEIAASKFSAEVRLLPSMETSKQFRKQWNGPMPSYLLHQITMALCREV